MPSCDIAKQGVWGFLRGSGVPPPLIGEGWEARCGLRHPMPCLELSRTDLSSGPPLWRHLEKFMKRLARTLCALSDTCFGGVELRLSLLVM